jgi:hypothetical protein
VILDRTQDLRRLVEQASQAASENEKSAALAVVRALVEGLWERISTYGAAQQRWPPVLSTEVRLELKETARELGSELAQLRDLSEDELAAYTVTGDQDGRGLLASIRRRGDLHLGALRNAQDELLQAWADEIWPSDKIAYLRVLSHLPHDRADAQAVLLARDDVTASIGVDRGLDSEELDRFQSAVSASAAEATKLAGANVPAEVVEFWQQLEADGTGLPLADLTPNVHEWLNTHGAASEFRVVRRTDANA